MLRLQRSLLLPADRRRLPLEEEARPLVRSKHRQNHLYQLQPVYDERFAREYGPWRPLVAQAADKVVLCVVLEHGLARIAHRRRRQPASPRSPRLAGRNGTYFPHPD